MPLPGELHDQHELDRVAIGIAPAMGKCGVEQQGVSRLQAVVLPVDLIVELTLKAVDQFVSTMDHDAIATASTGLQSNDEGITGLVDQPVTQARQHDAGTA